ncbi:MAG TPA: glycosyltransferase family 2 protein [Steroidobacteraceae bacterium]|jgi:cellulose synthase/poly-beta-1,6-N-acetylglucosamine synthase-like glycosyltransferase|nr:glycosyltransferase family 2 protein [Steroidobacteraceae bacterium]
MTRKQRWRIFAPLGVCALLGLWIALSAANARAASFSLVVYALANLIVYTDAVDFALRLFMRRRRKALLIATADNRDVSIDLVDGGTWSGRPLVPMRPYAIIASVFNLQPHLETFMQNYAPWRDKVWLISDGSTDHTVERLRAAGWRIFDDGVNRKKPGAIKRLLARLPAHIETVMVIDPDIRIRARGDGSTIDLERAIADFQRSGAAAACPRVMIEPDGFLARFQAFEYALAFRVGRESLADYSITSGVSIYRRAALESALAEHSLSVYAEDFENAIILLGRGESIYYDGRLVVSTEGPGAVRRWFSQRVGWYHGLIKVYAERLAEVWRVSRRAPFAMYHFILYVGVLSLALHMAKMVSAALLIVSFISGFDELFFAHLLPNGSAFFNPTYFISAVGGYLALGAIALFTVVPRAERAYTAPIVPLYLFYAIVHIAPMTVGFANWMALQIIGRRVYRDHYDVDRKDEATDGRSATRPRRAA